MNEYFVIELDHKDQVFNTYTIQSDLPIDQVCGEFARHMMDEIYSVDEHSMDDITIERNGEQYEVYLFDGPTWIIKHRDHIEHIIIGEI
jgi:hypothetical protein